MTGHSRPEILQVMADGRPGGGATMLFALTEDLIERGWAVHVVTEAGSDLARRAAERGAGVTGLSFFRSRFDRSLRRDIARVTRQSNASVAHIHGSRAMFAATGLGREIPSVYTVHGYHMLNRGVIDRVISSAAERRSSAAAKVVVHVSDEDARLSKNHRLVPAGTQSVTIRNGIEIPEEIGTDRRTEGGPLRIVSLSRLVAQKDPLLALDIMDRAPDGWRLELIGGGELESMVRTEVVRRGLQSKVAVLGAVPRSVALDHLRRSDVLLNTSRWEGLPLAPLEAMAHGVVVVAPSLPSFREVIPSNDSGVLVTGRDPNDFANAIAGLTDDEVRRCMAGVARKRVEEHFNWERTRNAYIALYEAYMRPMSRS